MIRRCSLWFVPLSLVALASGCGDSRYVTAEVQGTAVIGGNPVAAGTVTFTPVEADGSPRDGKSAVGVVQADGSFTLTTYEEGDGAIVGDHRVYYSSPEEFGPEIVDTEVGTDGQELAATSNAASSDPAIRLQVTESSSLVNVTSEEPNTVTVELENAPVEEEDDDEFSE